MFRFLAPALLASVALAPAASAQDQDSAGVIPPRGMSYETAQAMITMLSGGNKQVIDNCWDLGCVLIINDTSTYDVVGFYIDSAKQGRSAQWSRNQFGEPLWPSKATLRFKTGRAPDMCDLPVRFVLRHRETREKTEIAGNTSLCTAPHQDTLIRIKMLEGKVFVGNGEAADADELH